MDIKVGTSIVIDPEVKRKSKSILASEDKTLSGFIGDCLEKLIKENEMKGGENVGKKEKERSKESNF